MFKLVSQGISRWAVLLFFACFSYSAVSEVCAEKFSSKFLNKDIVKLELGEKITKVLRDNGINKVKHLLKTETEELRKITGLGEFDLGFTQGTLDRFIADEKAQSSVPAPRESLRNRVTAGTKALGDSALQTAKKVGETKAGQAVLRPAKKALETKAGQKVMGTVHKLEQSARGAVQSTVNRLNRKPAEETETAKQETAEQSVKPAETKAETAKKEEAKPVTEKPADPKTVKEPQELQAVATVPRESLRNRVTARARALNDGAVQTVKTAMETRAGQALASAGKKVTETRAGQIAVGGVKKLEQSARGAVQSTMNRVSRKSAETAEEKAEESNELSKEGETKADLSVAEVVDRMRSLNPYQILYPGTVGLYNYAEKYHDGKIKTAYDTVNTIAKDLRKQAEWNYRTAVQFARSADRKITEFNFKLSTMSSLKRNNIETIGQLFFAARNGNVYYYEDSSYNFDKLGEVALITVHDQSMRNLAELKYIGPRVLSDIIEVMTNAQVHPIIKKLFTGIKPSAVDNAVGAAVETTQKVMKTSVGQAAVEGAKRLEQSARGAVQSTMNRLSRKPAEETEKAEQETAKESQELQAVATAPRESLRNRVTAGVKALGEGAVQATQTAMETRAGQALASAGKKVAETRAGQAAVEGAKRLEQSARGAVQSTVNRLNRKPAEETETAKQETAEQSVKPAETKAETAEKAETPAEPKAKPAKAETAKAEQSAKPAETKAETAKAEQSAKPAETKAETAEKAETPAEPKAEQSAKPAKAKPAKPAQQPSSSNTQKLAEHKSERIYRQ